MIQKKVKNEKIVKTHSHQMKYIKRKLVWINPSQTELPTTRKIKVENEKSSLNKR